MNIMEYIRDRIQEAQDRGDVNEWFEDEDTDAFNVQLPNGVEYRIEVTRESR